MGSSTKQFTSSLSVARLRLSLVILIILNAHFYSQACGLDHSFIFIAITYLHHFIMFDYAATFLVSVMMEDGGDSVCSPNNWTVAYQNLQMVLI